MKEYADKRDVEAFITKCVKELGIDGIVGKKALEIMKHAEMERIPPGRNPIGQAAAAVYVASVLTKHRVTQASLASFAGVSEAIIRKRYVELVKGLGYYQN
ncbi:MAG: hypothetical protein ACFFD6_04225 [Candidatus Thorarchaeota archaeon]